MRRQPDISARNLEILYSIVREYITTGEPVASRTVARSRRDNLSAATVRNVMADLVDDGYLEQPHTSAGRVPTPKAFQLYVSSLTPKNATPAELERLRTEFSAGASAASRAELTCHILTGMTRSLSIAAAIPALDLVLSRVELVALGEGRVLFVVITEDQAVHNKVVSLNEGVTQDDLNGIRNYVNLHLTGMSLLTARYELERRLADERALYDRLLKRLSVFYRLGLLDIQQGPAVFTEGSSYLLALDLHTTREKLHHLFRTLEEKERVLRLLDLFLATNGDDLAVHVGLDELHPALGDFSMIGTTVRMPDGALTRIAVLGPMRMNYEKVISAVSHVREAVSA